MFAWRITISLGIKGGCDLNVANSIGLPLSGLADDLDFATANKWRFD